MARTRRWIPGLQTLIDEGVLPFRKNNALCRNEKRDVGEWSELEAIACGLLISIVGAGVSSIGSWASRRFAFVRVEWHKVAHVVQRSLILVINNAPNSQDRQAPLLTIRK